MNRNLINAFVVMLLLIGSAPAVVWAFEGHTGPGGHREVMHREGKPPIREMEDPGIGMMGGAEHHMWRHLRGLGLDERQKAEIIALRNRTEKEMVARRANEHIAVIELNELLDKDQVDMKAVEAKLRQIEAMKTEMRLSLIKTREEVKSKLTAEQREKFKEMPDRGPVMGARTGDHRHTHAPVHPKGQ